MGFLDMTREDKVAAFRKAANKQTFKEDGGNQTTLVSSCIDEEYAEFDEAMWNYVDDPNEETRAQLCKEWADLQYVVSQAAVYFNIPSEPSFNRVHNNNMTKVVNGRVRYREDGKILKPDNYVPADMRGL